MDEKKSIPSNKESISMEAVVPLESVRFAFSHAVLNLRKARLLSVKSLRCFCFNSRVKCCTYKLSNSSPPK